MVNECTNIGDGAVRCLHFMGRRQAAPVYTLHVQGSTRPPSMGRGIHRRGLGSGEAAHSQGVCAAVAQPQGPGGGRSVEEEA